MAKNFEIQIQDKKPKFPNNLLLLLPKLHFNTRRGVEVVIEKKPSEKQLGDDDKKICKAADVVKLSEPLTVEADDSGTTSNQIILWQLNHKSRVRAVGMQHSRGQGRQTFGFPVMPRHGISLDVDMA
ncbi:hypothetical protein V6N13_075233 [Hibiscus sabdariffa]|uniref:Uncharacterized protein n=1 Tax=Hibiscus sabdariffa TaxID=183260 RepID=A0ABR2UAV7_9ROSI